MCDDDHKSAYHEAGHVVFANLIGIPISYATIKNRAKRAETKETILGIFKLKISKYLKMNREMSIAYYLSGGKVQEYFCKDGEMRSHSNDNNEISSYGNISVLKANAERYIDDKLSDPDIRLQIRKVARVLLDQQYHYSSELTDVMDYQQNQIRSV